MEGTCQKWHRESPTNDKDVTGCPIDHMNCFPIPNYPTNISAHIPIPSPSPSTPDLHLPHELNELTDGPPTPSSTIPHPHPLPDCPTKSNSEHDNEPHQHRFVWIGQGATEYPRNTISCPLPWPDECASDPTSPSITPPPPVCNSHPLSWPNKHTMCLTTSCLLPWLNGCTSSLPTSPTSCYPHHHHEQQPLNPHSQLWPN